MAGHVFIIHGDITKCQADAIVYSTSTKLGRSGKLHGAFSKVDGFSEAQNALRGRGWNVGDTHWLPATATRPGIVFAFSIEHIAEDPKAQAAEIVGNAIRCAVKNLRVDKPTQRLLILLPTFLTGAGGAGRMRADLARVQVRAAMKALDDHLGVDVAFVLFQAADHSVFREARRELRPAADRVVREPELVDAVRRGECVVFVGSGISAGAGMVSWPALIEELRKPISDLASTPSTTTSEHLALAQLYRDVTRERGLRPLREVVRTLFGHGNSKEPTLSHYLLASLEARHVITTNYDQLLEQTLDAVRQRYLRVVQPRHVPATGNLGQVNVVKFHGDAEKGDDVIASAQDYEQFFENHPVFDLLLSGLLLNQTFLFVGYSLTDPNFKQIYDRISRLLGAAQRPAFATSFGSSSDGPPHVRVISFDGTIEEKTTALRCWLDDLVDVAREPVSLLLADAADAAHVSTPEMLELRSRLNRVGDEVVQRARRPLGAADAKVLAKVAKSLMEHGWRASCGNDRLLEMIATKLDLTEREPLVRFALAQADSHDSIARLEAMLASTPQG